MKHTFTCLTVLVPLQELENCLLGVLSLDDFELELTGSSLSQKSTPAVVSIYHYPHGSWDVLYKIIICNIIYVLLYDKNHSIMLYGTNSSLYSLGMLYKIFMHFKPVSSSIQKIKAAGRN